MIRSCILHCPHLPPAVTIMSVLQDVLTGAMTKPGCIIIFSPYNRVSETHAAGTETIPGIWNWDFLYRLRNKEDSGLPTGLRLLKPFCDNVLLEHGGLPQVLALVVHLILLSRVLSR